MCIHVTTCTYYIIVCIINVIIHTAITLKFWVEIVYAGDALTDVVPGADVETLNDENINGLAAVMTPLELTLSLPWEDSVPFS